MEVNIESSAESNEGSKVNGLEELSSEYNSDEILDWDDFLQEIKTNF